MTNKNVVEQFLNKQEAYTNNLHSTGIKLYSYSTVIAQWHNDVLLGNATKYSITTSKHMSYLKQYVDNWTSSYVPRGSNDLTTYTE